MAPFSIVILPNFTSIAVSIHGYSCLSTLVCYCIKNKGSYCVKEQIRWEETAKHCCKLPMALIEQNKSCIGSLQNKV